MKKITTFFLIFNLILINLSVYSSKKIKQKSNSLKKELPLKKKNNKKLILKLEKNFNPRNFDLKRADLYFKKKEYLIAQGFYLASLQSNENKTKRKDSKIYYRLGFISLIHKNYEKSKNYFQMALLTISPDSIKIKNKLHYNLAIVYKKLNQNIKSLFHFKKSFELDYKNLNIILQLGITQYKLKQYSNAIKTFKSGIKIDKKNDKILFNLAKTYHTKNNFQKAKKIYQNLLSVKPFHSDSTYNLILILIQEKNLIFAKKIILNFLKNKSNNDILLQYALILTKEQNWKKSIKMLKKVIKNNKENANAHIIISNTYYNTEEYQKSIDHLNKAIKIKQKKEEETNKLFAKIGDAAFKLKKYSMAIRYYLWALSKEINSNIYKKKLALSYFKKKNYTESIKIYLELIKKNKKNPILFQRLFESYYINKNYKKANKILNYLLLKFKNFSNIKKIITYKKNIIKYLIKQKN